MRSGGKAVVGRLATRLKALAAADQIGPWHIGHWIDFRHTPRQPLIIPLTLATSLSRANGLVMISIPCSIPLVAGNYTLGVASKE